jgi:hypothetical protein
MIRSHGTAIDVPRATQYLHRLFETERVLAQRLTQQLGLIDRR